ncbi:MAG: hypothetical protein AB7U44_04400 [Sulfuricurvum sp.]
MNEMADIPVNDIAPLAEVHDYSIYLFIGSVVLGSAVVISLMFWVLKKWKTRRLSERKVLYARLESVNFSDPKRAAYEISTLGRYFSADNERTQKAFHNLFERLGRYKYAPNVDAIDDETIGYYHLYLEIIDV